jgi:hypothetical protein
MGISSVVMFSVQLISLYHEEESVFPNAIKGLENVQMQ